jgi:hypothetical protein
MVAVSSNLSARKTKKEIQFFVVSSAKYFIFSSLIESNAMRDKSDADQYTCRVSNVLDLSCQCTLKALHK